MPAYVAHRYEVSLYGRGCERALFGIAPTDQNRRQASAGGTSKTGVHATLSCMLVNLKPVPVMPCVAAAAHFLRACGRLPDQRRGHSISNPPWSVFCHFAPRTESSCSSFLPHIAHCVTIQGFQYFVFALVTKFPFCILPLSGELKFLNKNPMIFQLKRFQ